MIRHLFKWGAINMVGNGKQRKFWSDVWLAELPLKLSYKSLYDICWTPGFFVGDLVNNGEWDI
jgi:hypothetical protein